MKKKLLVVSLLVLASCVINTTSLKAQNYATLNYWGKDIQLERYFFEILNSNRSRFMEKARDWKYYDFKDYNQLYNDLVDNLKSPSFIVIVTESNQLQTRNDLKNLPNSSESNKNKKNRARAGWQYYQLLLPSLQEFARGRM